MSDVYWLIDEQMARLEPYFLKSHGKPRVDDRWVLSGILFVTTRRCVDAMRPRSMNRTRPSTTGRSGGAGRVRAHDGKRSKVISPPGTAHVVEATSEMGCVRPIPFFRSGSNFGSVRFGEESGRAALEQACVKRTLQAGPCNITTRPHKPTATILLPVCAHEHWKRGNPVPPTLPERSHRDATVWRTGTVHLKPLANERTSKKYGGRSRREVSVELLIDLRRMGRRGRRRALFIIRPA